MPAVTQPVRPSRARRPAAVRAAAAVACEALEDRRLFSAYGWYSVKVPTPGGTHGNAALHTVGSLTADANDWHPTNDPVDAVNRRVTGTATVDSTPENAWLATHGQTGRVDTYTFGSSDAFRVNAAGTKIEFEDLKSFPTPPNDDDYDDHAWAVSATRQSLGSLSAKVSATADPANAVTDSGDLYVGEVDGRVSLDIAATLGGSGVTAGHKKHTLWEVKGPDTANEIAHGDFSGSTTATAEFPVPTHGRTVTVRVAFDDDASNTVSDNDTHVKEITVHIVKLVNVEAIDTVYPSNRASSQSTPGTVLVPVDDSTRKAQITFHVDVLEDSAEARGKVIWKVTPAGSSSTLPGEVSSSTGSFADGDVTIDVTAPDATAPGWMAPPHFRLVAGLDTDADGTVDSGTAQTDNFALVQPTLQFQPITPNTDATPGWNVAAPNTVNGWIGVLEDDKIKFRVGAGPWWGAGVINPATLNETNWTGLVNASGSTITSDQLEVGAYAQEMVFLGRRRSVKIEVREVEGPGMNYYTATRPADALIANNARNEANAWVTANFAALGGVTGAGDRADAARHVYWVALMTADMDQGRALDIATAHEYDNLGEGSAHDQIVMDLRNNARGAGIVAGAVNPTRAQIEALVMSYLDSGLLTYISSGLLRPS